MINVIVVTHGEFGSYLIEAAEGIVGAQGEGVVSVSISPRLRIDEVRKRLDDALRVLGQEDGVLLLADMPGGTPCNVAVPAAAGKKNTRVISGVNLYMLVTAFNHRRDTPLDDLAEKIIADGKKSIADIQKRLAAKS